MNTISYFEIQATEPEKLVAFYKKVFNWDFKLDPNIPIPYYRMTEGMMGAILQRPVPVPPPMSGTNAFTCSVLVKSFDETEKIILENGGIVAMPKFPIPGKCWQGYFVDPDHNVFGIFEVDEKAK